MTEEMTGLLYGQVIRITEDYLGPAAERFVVRLINAHLGKQPQELTIQDIPAFIEWAKVTLGLITENHQLVDEYEQKLRELAKVPS